MTVGRMMLHLNYLTCILSNLQSVLGPRVNKQLKMECEFQQLNDDLKAIAIDTKPIHFGNENENDDLQQSLFVLGARKELMLVIKEGVVCLSNPNSFVTLTPNRWRKLIDYREEINEEIKAFIHMSRSMFYRVHW